MLLPRAPNAPPLAAGLSMLQDARLCSRESLDIFGRTPSILLTRCGPGSAVLKSGIVTNGANGFPITRTIVAPRGNGPRIIFSDGGGGSGSSRCRAAMLARASFTTRGFSNFERDRLWDNDCTRTFSPILWVTKFSEQRK